MDDGAEPISCSIPMRVATPGTQSAHASVGDVAADAAADIAANVAAVANTTTAVIASTAAMRVSTMAIRRMKPTKTTMTNITTKTMSTTKMMKTVKIVIRRITMTANIADDLTGCAG